MFYKLNDIYQVKIIESGKKYWLLKVGNEYKDFLYNSGLTINKKDGYVIQSFAEFLNKNNLETMAFVQYNDNNLISKQLVIDILNMQKKIENISEEEYGKIDIISKTVGNMCCLILVDNCLYFDNNTFKDKYDVLYTARELLDAKSFLSLLNQSIKLDLIKNRDNDTKSSVGKGGLYIDYKISSILKALKIGYDVSKIKDFKIMYDENSIEQYDENGKCYFSVEFDKNKMKTIDNK